MSERPYNGPLGKEMLVPLYEGSIPYVTKDGILLRAYPVAVYKLTGIRPASVPEDALGPAEDDK